MFGIRKNLYSNKSNIPIHMKLFEDCVKPILLYCSEAWSLPRLIKGRDITIRILNLTMKNVCLLMFINPQPILLLWESWDYIHFL
jgi:hypothetical protein